MLAGVAIGAVLAVVGTLLAVLLPEDEKQAAPKDPAVIAAEDMTAASVNLLSGGVVRYEGRYTDPLLGPSQLSLRFGPGGTMLAETDDDGAALATMTVDGKSFIKGGDSYWERFGTASDTRSAYSGKWIKLPSEVNPGAEEMSKLAPETVARELRQAADRRQVRRGSPSTLHGVRVRRYTTPTRIVYLTAKPPLRIVRMVPVTARDQGPGSSSPSAPPTGAPTAPPTGLPSLPSMPPLPTGIPSYPSLPPLPSLLPSVRPLPTLLVPREGASRAGYTVRDSGVAGARPVRAKAAGEPSYSLDLPTVDDKQRQSFRREVDKDVRALRDSIDAGIRISADGKVRLKPCNTGGCTARVKIRNRVLPTLSGKGGDGDVAARVTIRITLDGRQVGRCVKTVGMSPGGTAQVSCRAEFTIPPSRNPRTHLVRADARGTASAMVQADIARVLREISRDARRYGQDVGVPGLSDRLADGAGGGGLTERFARAQGLREEDGWRWGKGARGLTSAEMMRKITGVAGKADIVNFDKRVGYQLAEGKPEIGADQVARDKRLIARGWRVVQVFSEEPSASVRRDLEAAGATVRVWSPAG
ncbi:hypothetical protein [Streptomyces palmae]|uniref:Tox-REase-5 domain-containing protein n=1 Tax=Streptomyces palmae TaxID=1701085 RepID=A0A4Z0H9E2_9ACTN|nr:hypothetical protein [Streptomyces palmae]TGB08518.1 hypothetical protein E4099_15355 [Streptomyces palmae]